MIILVCGSRDAKEPKPVFDFLDDLHAIRRITKIKNGKAPGIDTFSSQWAKSRGIPFTEYPADWTKYGTKAGPVRNQQMLDDDRPDGVVAFPGGRGTANMVFLAHKAGVPVLEAL